MAPPFRVRETAVQAGVSEVSVDRVLHGRPGVRASTTAQVERALAELDRQRAQLRVSGRTTVLDVVVAAPPRFCTAVRDAVEAVLPALHPAAVRCRSHPLPAEPALAGAGVPVVTLVTDLPGSARSAYAGLDNRAAGATAAHLLGQWLGRAPATCSSCAAGTPTGARTSGRRASGRSWRGRAAAVQVLTPHDLPGAG